MDKHYVDLSRIRESAKYIKAGDGVYLSGTIYLARDAAHKRLFELIEKGEKLPFDLKDATIYYAGPTEAREGEVIGSCGPTTSSRMDLFTPTLLDMGLACTVGKGNRSDEVTKAIVRNEALYLCAVGGAGAYISDTVTSCEVIAFEELGCESIKKLTVNNMPTFCAIDAEGRDIFKLGAE